MGERQPSAKQEPVTITDEKGGFTLRIHGAYFSETVAVKMDEEWVALTVHHVDESASITVTNDGETMDGVQWYEVKRNLRKIPGAKG